MKNSKLFSFVQKSIWCLKWSFIAWNKPILAFKMQNLTILLQNAHIYVLFYSSPGIPGEKSEIPENPRPRGKLKTGEISHPNSSRGQTLKAWQVIWEMLFKWSFMGLTYHKMNSYP